MTKNLIFWTIVFSLFLLVFILRFIRNNKLKIKYTLIWFILFYIFFLILVIPKFLEFLTNFLGFQTPSNMILCLLIAILIVINISITGILTSQDKKIRILVQEISLLKEKVNNEKKK